MRHKILVALTGALFSLGIAALVWRDKYELTFIFILVSLAVLLSFTVGGIIVLSNSWSNDWKDIEREKRKILQEKLDELHGRASTISKLPGVGSIGKQYQ
jgi:hypothetical protein